MHSKEKLLPQYPIKKFDVYFSKICQDIQKSYKAAQRLFVICYIVITSILNQSLVLFLKKIFMFMIILTLFFFFLFSKILMSFLRFFFASCFSLLQKDFDIFHVLLYGVFFCVFENIYLLFLYIEKIFLQFFLYALKLILLNELCKLCELCKLYELCKLNELYTLYELRTLYEYFMNCLQSLEMAENHSNCFKNNIFVFKNSEFIFC